VNLQVKNVAMSGEAITSGWNVWKGALTSDGPACLWQEAHPPATAGGGVGATAFLRWNLSDGMLPPFSRDRPASQWMAREGRPALVIETSANSGVTVDELSFEQVVSMHYQSLYRFALGLTGQENEAWDLAQQTFYRWATKGHQLQDKSKAKSWLFTTLHREFLNSLRRQNRFPHLEMEAAAPELPAVPPTAEATADGAIVLDALRRVEEPYRTVLLLFYLEDHSYREIADILGIPEGTVMSRISRGKALLRQLLADQAGPPARHELEPYQQKP
jgi:RNA polymerase sigma factor (sigma-70 family)